MQSGYPGYEPLILSIPTCNIENSLPELFREKTLLRLGCGVSDLIRSNLVRYLQGR